MEKYKIAKKLYSESKFETAIEYFKDSFNTEVLNENEKIDCLTQIIKIQKLVNKKEDSETVERELADFLIQRKEYSNASQVLGKLIDKKRSYDIGLKFIETLILDGNLERAEHEVVELFKYLYKNKNFQKTQELYSKVNLKLPENIKFDSFLLLSFISQGDLNSIEEKKDKFNKDVLYEALMNVAFNHWRHSSIFFNITLENAHSINDYLLNKRAVKLLLEVLLMGKPFNLSELANVLKYFISKERKTVSRLICLYAEEVNCKLDESLMNRIDSLPEDDEIETDFDLGEDLLGENVDGMNEIQELVKKIQLLETMGEEHEANLLRKKLKTLDPQNGILKQETTGSRLKVKRIETSDLEEEWNNTFQNDLTDQDELIVKAISTIASLTEKELLHNYRDLVICFNTMELYKASMEVISRVEARLGKDVLKDDLELCYLKIKTMYGDQDYFKAYDLVTRVNGAIPMSEDKRIEFLYLQGEIARKLGRIKDAIKSYQLVRNINPKYRLVNQRLQSFG